MCLEGLSSVVPTRFAPSCLCKGKGSRWGTLAEVSTDCLERITQFLLELYWACIRLLILKAQNRFVTVAVTQFQNRCVVRARRTGGCFLIRFATLVNFHPHEDTIIYPIDGGAGQTEHTPEPTTLIFSRAMPFPTPRPHLVSRETG